jgi:hypothetical protein
MAYMAFGSGAMIVATAGTNARNIPLGKLKCGKQKLKEEKLKR